MRLVQRVHTAASPGHVWALLSLPSSWPQFDLLFRSVKGARGPAAPGQHLMGLTRFGLVRLPVDIVEAVEGKRLVLVVHTAPGVRERVAYDLTAAARGGCDVQVSRTVEGLFAPLAVLPLFLSGNVSVRLLAARAERAARTAARGAA